MVNQLNERKNKLLSQLNDLEKQPQAQAEKRGQISENIRTSEIEINEDETKISEIDKKINFLRSDLSSVQEKMIQIREKEHQGLSMKIGKALTFPGCCNDLNIETCAKN